MKYYQPLEFPVEAFDKDTLINSIKRSFDPKKLSIWKIDTSMFTKEIHLLVESVGCKIFYAELFHTPPRTNLVWHLDANKSGNFMRINFVWGSNKQLMQWGRLVKETAGFEDRTYPTMTGTVSINFKEHEVHVLENYVITTPTIVCVGVPHRVVNFGNTSRFCLSMNLYTKNGEKLLFEESKQLFSEYVLD
jgi:hypothetical protein